MLNLRSWLRVAALAALPLPGHAQTIELNMMTGGEQGTYIQIGKNIAALGAQCSYNLNVRPSAGSLENVFAVRDRPVTQFGIVQSDVLEYLKTLGARDARLRRAAEGLRIMLPLYNEDIHILGRSDIADLSGLAGKRVYVGAEGSGTALTAGLVLDLAEIRTAERVTGLSPQGALDALMAGNIDAMFYVVGAPATLFNTDAIDGDRFHLIPTTDTALQAVYTPTTLPPGTYPFQSAPVDIVSVKSVLMTYDFDENKNAYHRRSCQGIADIMHLVVSRFDQLKANGHPKWQQIDITDIPPGWEVSSCVMNALEPTYSFKCTAPDGTMSVEGAQGGEPQDRNELFLQRACEKLGC